MPALRQPALRQEVSCNWRMEKLRRKVVHRQNGVERQSKLRLRGFVAPYIAARFSVSVVLLASVTLLSLTAGAPVRALTTALVPPVASSQTPIPLTSETAALDTPAPAPLRAPTSRLALVWGALLCITALAMLLLGSLIFLVGLGTFDRSRRQRVAPQRVEGSKPPVSTSPPRPEEKLKVSTRPASKPSAPTKPSSLPAADKAFSPEVAAICPNCGRANRPQARYCAACGTPLQAVPSVQEKPSYCWSCGYRLRPTSRYCPRCGDKI